MASYPGGGAGAFGAYRRLKVLGSGAYGEAVLVERRADAVKLVCKELHASHLSAEDLAKAEQEALVLKRLSHSNIICLVDSFVEDGKFAIVTDFADRGDLAAFIADRKTARQRAVERHRPQPGHRLRV